MPLNSERSSTVKRSEPEISTVRFSHACPVRCFRGASDYPFERDQASQTVRRARHRTTQGEPSRSPEGQRFSPADRGCGDPAVLVAGRGPVEVTGDQLLTVRTATPNLVAAARSGALSSTSARQISAARCRGRECLEGEEVELGTGTDELPHGPTQRPQRYEFDGVGKLDDRAEHIRSDGVIDRAEAPRHRSDDCRVGQRSAEPVVPQARRGDRRARWAKGERLVIEEYAEEHVVVEQDGAQARSGSCSATAATSAS